MNYEYYIYEYVVYYVVQDTNLNFGDCQPSSNPRAGNIRLEHLMAVVIYKYGGAAAAVGAPNGDNSQSTPPQGGD